MEQEENSRCQQIRQSVILHFNTHFSVRQSHEYTGSEQRPQGWAWSGRIWVICNDIVFPAAAPGEQRHVPEPLRLNLTSFISALPCSAPVHQTPHLNVTPRSFQSFLSVSKIWYNFRRYRSFLASGWIWQPLALPTSLFGRPQLAQLGVQCCNVTGGTLSCWTPQ